MGGGGKVIRWLINIQEEALATWQQKRDFQMFPWLARDQHLTQLTHDPKNVIYSL